MQCINPHTDFISQNQQSQKDSAIMLANSNHSPEVWRSKSYCGLLFKTRNLGFGKITDTRDLLHK